MVRANRRLAGFLVAMSTSFANWNDTFTGIDLDKLPHPNLKQIRSWDLRKDGRVEFDGITATADYHEALLRGRAKSGKRWEVRGCGSCFQDIWRADVDGNGTNDYIFFGGGPLFNGRTTPLYSLTILLMDRQGLPVPFFTFIYQGEQGNGIKHLVDLDHDGRIQLLVSTYDEGVSDPRVGAFCSGHWVTQLYRFRNLGAEEIRGNSGKIAFPFIHDWTYRGTECFEQDPPFMSAQPPTLYEHGTSAAGELTASIRESKKEGSVMIDPVDGCQTVEPRMIVFDRPRIRQISLLNLMSTYNVDILTAIYAARVPVKLRGLRGNGACGVNLLWAAL